MAGVDREAIYEALRVRLAGVGSITQGVSRRLPPGAPPSPLEQPCAFIPAGDETPEYHPNQPAKWTFSTAIIVYTRTDAPDVAPSSVLAPLVKDIEAALQWRAGDQFIGFGGPGTWTNLGGLCSHCAIDKVIYGEGVPDGQGVAFIHISIVAEARA